MKVLFIILIYILMGCFATWFVTKVEWFNMIDFEDIKDDPKELAKCGLYILLWPGYFWAVLFYIFLTILGTVCTFIAGFIDSFRRKQKDRVGIRPFRNTLVGGIDAIF